MGEGCSYIFRLDVSDGGGDKVGKSGSGGGRKRGGLY